ncbi:MAG: glycosyltransferase [Ginsengibacter sp.]
MKIIHCLIQYMPQAMAGTEIYIHTLATLQKGFGHQVAVVTPHIDFYRPGEINEHYVYDEIDVYQYLEKGDPTDREVHYGTKKPEGLNNFVALLARLKPDVIHFHELNRSIGFTIEHVKLARQSGTRIFLTMHQSFYTCNTNVLIYNNNLCDGIIRNFRCSECSYKTLLNVPGLLAKPLAALSMAVGNTHITGKLPAGKIKTLLSFPSYISRIKKQLDELWKNVDQLICLNSWYKNILLENGVPEKKIVVVPQALVTTEKKETTKIHRQSGLPLKMVFIGRIHPIKGIHLIIDAMRLFSPEQAQIDIYGRPEETEYYKKCISDTKEMPSIKWKGEIKREDVIECLTRYDVFCLASTSSEMAPLVIREAFAAGIPVLASRVYGNIEQVEDGVNGLLFEFNSSGSLKEKIQMLIDDHSLIEHLKNNIVAPLNFDAVNESYLRLYGSV